jgi:hypothetical protein
MRLLTRKEVDAERLKKIAELDARARELEDRIKAKQRELLDLTEQKTRSIEKLDGAIASRLAELNRLDLNR